MEQRRRCSCGRKSGIMRKVESYDMMEQPKMKEWLREHVLLITTGYAIRNDKEALLELIRNMHEANCSALAIKTRFFDDFRRRRFSWLTSWLCLFFS